jgi:hypothetical protein
MVVRCSYVASAALSRRRPLPADSRSLRRLARGRAIPLAVKRRPSSPALVIASSPMRSPAQTMLRGRMQSSAGDGVDRASVRLRTGADAHQFGTENR